MPAIAAKVNDIAGQPFFSTHDSKDYLHLQTRVGAKVGATKEIASLDEVSFRKEEGQLNPQYIDWTFDLKCLGRVLESELNKRFGRKNKMAAVVSEVSDMIWIVGHHQMPGASFRLRGYSTDAAKEGIPEGVSLLCLKLVSYQSSAIVGPQANLHCLGFQTIDFMSVGVFPSDYFSKTFGAIWSQLSDKNENPLNNIQLSAIFPFRLISKTQGFKSLGYERKSFSELHHSEILDSKNGEIKIRTSQKPTNPPIEDTSLELYEVQENLKALTLYDEMIMENKINSSSREYFEKIEAFTLPDTLKDFREKLAIVAKKYYTESRIHYLGFDHNERLIDMSAAYVEALQKGSDKDAIRSLSRLFKTLDQCSLARRYGDNCRVLLFELLADHWTSINIEKAVLSLEKACSITTPSSRLQRKLANAYKELGYFDAEISIRREILATEPRKINKIKQLELLVDAERHAVAADPSEDRTKVLQEDIALLLKLDPLNEKIVWAYLDSIIRLGRPIQAIQYVTYACRELNLKDQFRCDLLVFKARVWQERLSRNDHAINAVVDAFRLDIENEALQEYLFRVVERSPELAASILSHLCGLVLSDKMRSDRFSYYLKSFLESKEGSKFDHVICEYLEGRYKIGKIDVGILSLLVNSFSLSRFLEKRSVQLAGMIFNLDVQSPPFFSSLKLLRQILLKHSKSWNARLIERVTGTLLSYRLVDIANVIECFSRNTEVKANEVFSDYVFDFHRYSKSQLESYVKNLKYFSLQQRGEICAVLSVLDQAKRNKYIEALNSYRTTLSCETLLSIIEQFDLYELLLLHVGVWDIFKDLDKEIDLPTILEKKLLDYGLLLCSKNLNSTEANESLVNTLLSTIRSLEMRKQLLNRAVLAGLYSQVDFGEAASLLSEDPDAYFRYLLACSNSTGLNKRRKMTDVALNLPVLNQENIDEKFHMLIGLAQAKNIYWSDVRFFDLFSQTPRVELLHMWLEHCELDRKQIDLKSEQLKQLCQLFVANLNHNNLFHWTRLGSLLSCFSTHEDGLLLNVISHGAGEIDKESFPFLVEQILLASKDRDAVSLVINGFLTNRLRVNRMSVNESLALLFKRIFDQVSGFSRSPSFWISVIDNALEMGELSRSEQNVILGLLVECCLGFENLEILERVVVFLTNSLTVSTEASERLIYKFLIGSRGIQSESPHKLSDFKCRLTKASRSVHQDILSLVGVVVEYTLFDPSVGLFEKVRDFISQNKYEHYLVEPFCILSQVYGKDVELSQVVSSKYVNKPEYWKTLRHPGDQVEFQNNAFQASAERDLVACCENLKSQYNSMKSAEGRLEILHSNPPVWKGYTLHDTYPSDATYLRLQSHQTKLNELTDGLEEVAGKDFLSFKKLLLAHRALLIKCHLQSVAKGQEKLSVKAEAVGFELLNWQDRSIGIEGCLSILSMSDIGFKEVFGLGVGIQYSPLENDFLVDESFFKGKPVSFVKYEVLSSVFAVSNQDFLLEDIPSDLLSDLLCWSRSLTEGERVSNSLVTESEWKERVDSHEVGPLFMKFKRIDVDLIDEFKAFLRFERTKRMVLWEFDYIGLYQWALKKHFHQVSSYEAERSSELGAVNRAVERILELLL